MMTLYCIRFGALLCAAAAAMGAAYAETLEGLETKLAKQWEDVESFKVDITIDVSIPLPLVSITMKQTGPMEFKRFEDSGRFRMDLSGTMGASLPGLGEGVQQRMLSVYDGEYIYSEMELLGQKKVGRKKPDATDISKADGGKSLLNAMKKLGTVTLLPDETVDSAAVHVVEVKYNEDAIAKSKGQADRQRLYLNTETGMQERMTVFKGDVVVMDLNYGEYETNVDIPDERFTYTPPPGVTVEDMDKMSPGGGLF